MTRIIAVLAGFSLLGIGAARADDAKTETTAESHHDKDGTGKEKKEIKSHHNGRTDTASEEHKVSKDMSGGTTETKEVKSDQDMGNMHHHKTMKKHTVKKDKNGNVVEKKDEAK